VDWLEDLRDKELKWAARFTWAVLTYGDHSIQVCVYASNMYVQLCTDAHWNLPLLHCCCAQRIAAIHSAAKTVIDSSKLL